MRALLVALLLVAFAAPALAQTTAIPIRGTYEDVYVVFGRGIDSNGDPVRGGVAVITIEQENVKMEPLEATLNCKGDFLTAFNLRTVDPAGKVKVTLKGPPGGKDSTASVSLDPFYRRSDVTLKLDSPWGASCRDERDVWPVSASVSLRLLVRTDPIEKGDLTFHARPWTGIVKMRFETPDGNNVCPPHPQDQTPGACELFQADERGDIRYTFTLDRPFDTGGRVDVTSVENETLSWQVAIDPVTRLGVRMIEVTGRGAPPELYDTPFPGVAALALVALAAVGARSLLSRRAR